MYHNLINEGIRPLFQKIEATGILLDEGKLVGLIQWYRSQLAQKKQILNREFGFTVDIYSEEHWNRVRDELGEGVFGPWIESRMISFLIHRIQQVYHLANGNHRVLGRRFGLYPKYGLDTDGRVVTISELSIGDLPVEMMGVVSYQDMILIKATYLDIGLWSIQELSGDPWIAGASVLDLVKLGFINLFEDYRLSELGAEIFAILGYSIFLFAPENLVDSVSTVIRECLENVHSDFTLRVDIALGISLDKLVQVEKNKLIGSIV